jgi:hypothetical protein
MPWWTLEDLQDRLSEYRVAELLDDDNEGTADAGAVKPGPLERLQRDSDSYVGAALADVYPNYPFAANAVPNECIRLSLDAAEMFLAKRHPTVIRMNWLELKEALDKDLDRVRTAKRSLGQRPPDPAANHGGAVYPTPGRLTGNLGPIFSGGRGKWGFF